MDAVTEKPQRVMVIGSGGAGKSTLAKQLGKQLDLPVVHLDRYFWQDGWVPTPRAAWRARLRDFVAMQRWVIDGNYGSSLDIRLHRADLIVFLDLPRRVTIAAVVRRRIRYHGRSRPDLPPGCPERLDWKFVVWLWNFPRRSRPRLLAAIREASAEDRVIRLRSRRAIQQWLRSVT